MCPEGPTYSWRSKELAKIRFEHLSWSPILLPTSKTDQECHGRRVFIDIPDSLQPSHPVALLRTHLDINNIHFGPLFWQWRHLLPRSDKQLSADGVSALVKYAACNILNLTGRYSGHSLRIGAATSMVWKIMSSCKPVAGLAPYSNRYTCALLGLL